MDRDLRNLIARITPQITLFFACLAITLRPLISGLAANVSTNLLLQLFVLAALFFWLMDLALQRELRAAKTGLGIPLTVFWLLALLSVFVASYRASALVVLTHWTSHLLFFLVLVNLCQNRSARDTCTRALLATATVVAVYALHQRFFGLAGLKEQIEGDPDSVLRIAGIPKERLGDLMARVEMGEVFSTFVYPNALAGFLLLMIPVALGYAVDRFQAGKPGRGAWCVVAVCIAMLAALFYTGSKGGWICFVAAAGAFFLLVGRGFLRKRWLPLLVGLAVLSTLIGLGFRTGALRWGAVLDAVASFQVRQGYWQAGWQMVKDHLWLGVGLDNFAEYYPFYKEATAREVQKAHNNFLQVWAETGAFGFLAFLSIWACFFRQIAATEVAPPDPGDQPPASRSGLGAGLFAIFLAHWLVGSFTTSDKAPWLLTIGLCVCWLLVYALTAPEPGVTCRYTGLGIVAGLVGFLTHCLIDFDLYVPGIFQTVCVLMALGLASRKLAGSYTRELGARGQIVVTLMAVAVFAVAMYGALPRAAETERCKLEADTLFAEATDGDGHLRDPLRLEQAAENYSRAAELNPLWREPAAGLARCHELRWWELTRRKDDTAFRAAVKGLQQALALSPRNSAFHARLATLFEDAARYTPQLLTQYREEYVARAAAHDLKGQVGSPLLPALVEHAEAVRLFPTRPHLRIQLARAYALAGLPQRATEQYRLALELNKQMPTPQMMLGKGMMQEAEKACGRPESRK